MLGMVLYGHWKGLIRLAVSMLALIVTLVIVRFAMPYATEFIKENTSIYSWMVERMETAFQVEEPPKDEWPEMSGDTSAAFQRRFIEEMELPEEIKELLIENNNSEVYRMLGVDAFAGYIGNYLAHLMLNFIGFVVLFLLVYVGLRLLAGALDLVARLPILSGMNQLAGAVLGGVHGLIYVWIFFLILTIFSRSALAGKLMPQIRSSVWLSYLYRYNLISRLVLGIVRGMFS